MWGKIFGGHFWMCGLEPSVQVFVGNHMQRLSVQVNILLNIFAATRPPSISSSSYPNATAGKTSLAMCRRRKTAAHRDGPIRRYGLIALGSPSLTEQQGAEPAPFRLTAPLQVSPGQQKFPGSLRPMLHLEPPGPASLAAPSRMRSRTDSNNTSCAIESQWLGKKGQCNRRSRRRRVAAVPSSGICCDRRRVASLFSPAGCGRSPPPICTAARHTSTYPG